MECVKAQFLSLAPIPEGLLLFDKTSNSFCCYRFGFRVQHFMYQSLKLIILCDAVWLGEGTGIVYSKICPWLPVSDSVTADK